ncbi:MAG: Rpn family recombination-promoting nuclease/putative transposase [Candidatus Fibromonas sp.]|jgi:predicted transposase/invertase (TIGR01784 family)|nr:Rpn family recombination-promoting nuclease/putative transposase [Candidatus Fibromonas sp.]
METYSKLAPKGKFAQLTLDFPFKKTFASEGGENLLIALLNAFLERKLAHPITQVVIQNPYIQGQTKASRDAILDIRCQDSMGNRFIVEMQLGRQEHFIKRVIYYLSMAIADSAHKGEDWDFNFPNLYSLNFLNYDLCFGKGNDGVVQYLCLCNEEHPEIKYDYLNLVFVRLARFYKSIKECNSFQDKLLFTLCNAHILKEKPKELEGELFDRIFEIARITNFSAEELSEYEASRMNMLDYNASMKFARKEGVAIGTAIGRDEGVAIGEARGVAIGRDEGIAIGREEIFSLLEKGMSLDEVKEKFKR